MDDPMLDLMAGNDELARRLGAYGRARLTPDLAASSRMRARVLAVAHRQATRARADSGLAVLDGPSADRIVAIDGTERPPALIRTHRVRRSLLAAAMVAMLSVAAVTGTALAARAGGPLYGTRLWVEEVTLPSGSSERALAELGRLRSRLDEAAQAAATNDSAGAEAALSAYAAIVDEATTRAVLADDEVAAAAIGAGVARDVTVLQALVDRLPATASEAVSRAAQRALERSGSALDSIDRSKSHPTGGNGAPGQGPVGGGPGAGNPNGEHPGAGQPPVDPGQTKPTATPPPAPQKTPKPDKKPPAGGQSTAHPTPNPSHGPHSGGGSRGRN